MKKISNEEERLQGKFHVNINLQKGTYKSNKIENISQVEIKSPLMRCTFSK
ncbi:hypothetical protein KFK09_013269 [Dendrobium nobile]|uniref:Uncharacterized protein n=1 Tax=Dendrobium nobile TaxID=94219 RepID=A0A8T3BCM7_DENNO|nr:hypothetical protein KFK09_013269 [Dendrobium nobile]